MDLISISQCSVGVIEAGVTSKGFYSDKIGNCRASVFQCEVGTVFIHDSGQLRLPEIMKLLLEQGQIYSVSYAFGEGSNQEPLHTNRLNELKQSLNFVDDQAIYIPKQGFSVGYLPQFGLVDAADPRLNSMRRLQDEKEEAREAVNILNNWFTEPNSQSVPLDVQYRRGDFTPLTCPALSVNEMLLNLRDDQRHGLLGAAALCHYGPKAGLRLPEILADFVRAYDLGQIIFDQNALLHQDSQRKRQLTQRFTELPIFK